MKRILTITAFAMALAMTSFAQGTMAEPRSLDTITADIEKQQNVSSLDQVKLASVKPALLQELGDAVMDVMIGNPTMHDAMDRMLGGDGSPRLEAFHSDLGAQYIRNGGLDGVRFGNRGAARLVSIEGTLGFQDDQPTIKTKDGSYILGIPNFYYYAYTDGLTAGTKLKVEGYLFQAVSGGEAYFEARKATINGKSYDFGGYRRGYGSGMMGGYGGGYGPGMMGGY